MNTQHRRWLLAALGPALAGATLRAMFMLPDLENVPIDRVARNLEREVSAHPEDVTLRLNLARVHAMAWADKSGLTPTLKRRMNPFPAGAPWFGPYPGFQHVHVSGTADPAKLAAARENLQQAITGYRAVVAADPTNDVAQLGLAWCQEQAGETAEAIAGYRRVIADVWPKEHAGDLPIGNFQPTTVEVAGYLIPLLDPIKDAAEVATLRERIAQLNVQMETRPETPIVVPLTDRLAPADLVDYRARVAFDADGSGIENRWTWITPDAAWLVFDRRGRGEVTSALQWFGPVTFWLFWHNGYDALRALDDNGDGSLSGRELDGLALWRDLNSNGITDAGEVRPVVSWGIVRLSCAYDVRADDPTLAAYSPRGVTFSTGASRPTYDIMLFPR